MKAIKFFVDTLADAAIAEEILDQVCAEIASVYTDIIDGSVRVVFIADIPDQCSLEFILDCINAVKAMREGE